MVHHVEFMDVADSDFLGHNRELDDDDSEFETVFEKYFVFSAAKNRFFARKLPLHFVLGSGIGTFTSHASTLSYSCVYLSVFFRTGFAFLTVAS